MDDHVWDALWLRPIPWGRLSDREICQVITFADRYGHLRELRLARRALRRREIKTGRPCHHDGL